MAFTLTIPKEAKTLDQLSEADLNAKLSPLVSSN